MAQRSKLSMCKYQGWACVYATFSNICLPVHNTIRVRRISVANGLRFFTCNVVVAVNSHDHCNVAKWHVNSYSWEHSKKIENDDFTHARHILIVLTTAIPSSHRIYYCFTTLPSRRSYTVKYKKMKQFTSQHHADRHVSRVSGYDEDKRYFCVFIISLKWYAHLSDMPLSHHIFP